MNANSLETLEQTELFQLALDAGHNNNSDAVLSYLKEAVLRVDATAAAHYLLGAEYAQARMYEAAISEMETAIALDPSLDIARFQLGLLWLTSGEAANAQTVLSPLEELAEIDPLHHFGKGLSCLIQDQFADCVQHLKQGIELNSENLPLNNDMQRILDEIAKIDAHSTSAEVQDETENADAQHIFLSAYTDKGDH